MSNKSPFQQHMAKPVGDEYKSPLAALLEEAAKNRPYEDFDISGFFGLGGKNVPKVRVRVPTKWEQDRALDLAKRYVKENADEEESRKDPKLLQDAELACVAWHACREVPPPPTGANPEPLDYPAFPSPTWMCKTFTADQGGVLVNLVNGVRAKHAPMPVRLDEETLDQVSASAAALGTTDVPDRVIGGWPREVLAHAFIMLAMREKAARDDATWLREVLEKIRAKAPDLVATIMAEDAPETAKGEPEGSGDTEPAPPDESPA